MRIALLVAVAASPLLAQDLVLKAMKDELERSKSLRLPNSPAPYYIEYGLDDVDSFHVSASLGAVVARISSKLRAPRVAVRVGSPQFDNTNYIFSDFFGRGGGSRLAQEDDYDAIRHYFWLSTDRVFKGSVQAIARKVSALRNVSQTEKLNDFAKAEPLDLDLGKSKPVWQRDEWTAMVKRLSAAFASYPEVVNSAVELDTGFGTSHVVNSDGTQLRYPDDLFSVRVRASAQAPDGMPLRLGLSFHARTLAGLPSEQEIRTAVERLASDITALVAAPIGEDYSGPVVLAPTASAQLFAQVIAMNLGLTRKPIAEPGRNFPLPVSELEGRLGSRILPEWIDVVDDPTLEKHGGQELLGYYPVDMEGIKPAPVTVIEAGKVKNFLLTRQPVRGFEGSNGRARLPGVFGAKMALFSNVLVKARETVPGDALEKKLIELIGQRGKPYGLLVTRLDYPTAGTNEDMQRLSTATSQRGGGRPVSSPEIAYRVYPDGRKELVRGLRFRGINVRSFRDIIAAGDQSAIFSFVGNGLQLPGLGSSGYVAGHSVIAPAVLFEDMELEKAEEDWPKLPIVPSPALLSQR
jgi:predicted Zn-dependent protease